MTKKDKKSQTVVVRLTPQERQEVEAKISSTGLNISDYLRCLLELMEVPSRVTDVAWETHDSLGKISSSMNRIEKILTTMQPPYSPDESTSFKAVCDELGGSVPGIIQLIQQVRREIKGGSVHKQ